MAYPQGKGGARVGAGGVVGVSATRSAKVEEGRQRAAVTIPEPKEIGAISLGEVLEAKSRAFGYEIVSLGGGDVPYFELRLRLDAGSAILPEGSAAARMLSSSFLGGTRNRSSEEIARALQLLGASVSCSIGSDGTLVTAGGLAQNFEKVLELLRELLFESEYPEEEVNVARSRVIQALAIQHSQPAQIASDALRRTIYGKHVYGRITPEPSSATRCDRSDLLSLHRKVFRAEGGRFIVVSGLPNKRVIGLLRNLFDDTSAVRHWTRPSVGRLRSPRPDFTSRLVLVNRPGSVQTVIRVSMEAPVRSDPSYHAFLLANTVFGGYFSSRLVENVRESKGYAYGISSSILHRRLSSTVTISADVATEVTAAALVEIFYELDRMITCPPSEDEIESARRYLIGSTEISLDTYAGGADSLDSLYKVGLDKRYLEELRDRLYGVSASGVREAAEKYLDRRRAVIVLVGNAAEIERPLRRVLEVPVAVANSPKEI